MGGSRGGAGHRVGQFRTPYVIGAIDLPQPQRGPVRVRFTNTGGKKVLRAEAHLIYRTADPGKQGAAIRLGLTGGERSDAEQVVTLRFEGGGG